MECFNTSTGQDPSNCLAYCREKEVVFDKAHSGVYGAHLQEAKIHGQLLKHYWWQRMCADITTYLV